MVDPVHHKGFDDAGDGQTFKALYGRLGDAVTNELVDWMNQVDAAYKSDLKEVNEQNFARFDAKLEQRIAELRMEIRGVEARLDAKIDVSIANLRASIDETLRSQTRFQYFAWSAILIVIVPLWFRH
jgi:hypothetical protein